MENKIKIETYKISRIQFALDEFFEDVPILNVVSYFVKLYKTSNETFYRDWEDENGIHEIKVNIKTNKCFIDFEKQDVKQVIQHFDDQIDPLSFSEKISCLDVTDYISGIVYKDGTWISIDVKNKSHLKGIWSDFDINNLSKDILKRALEKLEGKEGLLINS